MITTIRSVPTKGESEALEKLIDRIGIDALAAIIAGICEDKAEHIRTNWQNESLALLWEAASQKFADLGDILATNII